MRRREIIYSHSHSELPSHVQSHHSIISYALPLDRAQLSLLPRLNGLRGLGSLNVRRHLGQPHIAAIERRSLLRRAEKEVHGEPNFEGVRRVDLIDVLLCELDLEGVDVAFEVRRFAAADDREDVGRFGHDVGEAGGVLVRDGMVWEE